MNPSIDAMIRAHVARDLLPTPVVVHTTAALSGILGGILSLFICGQFGFGMTSWAQAFSTHIHETMPAWLCSVVCGTLFAVFPISMMRLACSPMRFHVLLKRHFFTVAMWFGLFGSILAVFGHHGNSFDQFSIWVAALLVCTLLLGRTIETIELKWDFSAFLVRGCSIE